MAFTPRPARCRNCTKRFTKTKKEHYYCSAKCRYEFKQNCSVGAAQIQKMIARDLKAVEKRLTGKLITAVKRSGPRALHEETKVDVWIRDSIIELHKRMEQLDELERQSGNLKGW
jgi:hypothetical protein